VHTLVWPSTGNYGIGGAFVGPRMGFDSLVLLPELMSRERFEKIESLGARYIKTPGCAATSRLPAARATSRRSTTRRTSCGRTRSIGL